MIPKNRTEKFLNWSDVQRVPLGVLFILVAGLSLSLAFTTSGLADYLGTKLSALSILPFPVVVILIVSITMIIGNTMSNTATASYIHTRCCKHGCIESLVSITISCWDYII